MQPSHDPHGLLLQVVAHDLLSPLTAVKWQCELLERSNLDDAKRMEYVKNIEHATTLGISIAKNAHIAARMLSSSYAETLQPGNLSGVLRDSFTVLKDQFARHGIALKVDIEDVEVEQSFDHELVSFYAWLLGKYFLTCVPAGTKVEATGTRVEQYGVESLQISVSAPHIESKQKAEAFVKDSAQTALDQTFVFSHLVRLVAPRVRADVHCTAVDDVLIVETTFPAY